MIKKAIVTQDTPEQEELPVLDLPGIIETPNPHNVSNPQQPVSREPEQVSGSV